MDVLISPGLIDLYVKTRNKLAKNVGEKLIRDIIESDDNTIVLNQKLLDAYEAQFPDQTTDRDFFHEELVALINNRSIVAAAAGHSIQSLLQATEAKYLLDARRRTYVNLGLTAADITGSRYSARLNHINEPKDNLLFILSARGKHGISFWPHDFKSNAEIMRLFDNLYDLRRNASPVGHYNRYVSVNHHYHDRLINEGTRFTYYTGYGRRHHRIDDDARIRAKYRNRVTILRGPEVQIHERRLIWMDLMIAADNDWENLIIEEPAWKIDIYVCHETCTAYRSAKQPYF